VSVWVMRPELQPVTKASAVTASAAAASRRRWAIPVVERVTSILLKYANPGTA